MSPQPQHKACCVTTVPQAAFQGIAANGNDIQRACGVEFGPDGNLYVLDADNAVDTGFDRILRFDPATGALLDVFVTSGSLENACAFTFGPDGHIYVPDLYYQQTRSFNGTSGDLQRILVDDQAPNGSPIFGVVFGLDGYAYAPTAERILRFDSETGRFVDTFVEGKGGTIVFFPASVEFGSGRSRPADSLWGSAGSGFGDHLHGHQSCGADRCARVGRRAVPIGERHLRRVR